jgi:hypothetical protein
MVMPSWISRGLADYMNLLLKRVLYCEWHAVGLTIYYVDCTHPSLDSHDCVVTANTLMLTGYVL